MGLIKRRAAAWAVPLIGVLVALLAVGSPARGAGFATGFADPGFVSPDRDQLLDEAVNAEARYVRINLPWASIATRAPAQPADPADPAYDFRA